jgi:hypothetical protein
MMQAKNPIKLHDAASMATSNIATGRFVLDQHPFASI